MRHKTTLHALRTDTRKSDPLPGWLAALCCIAAILMLTLEDQAVSTSVTAGTALLAVMAAQPRALLFCAGLTITLGASRAAGVPLGVLVPVAAIVGTLLSTGAKSSKKSPPSGSHVPLLALTIGTGLYAIARPATANAALLTSYVLVVLPLTLFALGIASRTATTSRGVNLSFGLGAGISVGAGLLQAYQAVGQNYSDYESARIFESAIGSSNLAAGMAAVVGVHLLSISGDSKGVARFTLTIASLVFLSAPLVFASRGAVLAVAFGVLSFALLARHEVKLRSGIAREVPTRLKRALVIALSLLALAAVAARQGWFVWDRLIGQTQSNVGVASGRGELWAVAVELIYREPFLGGGPGSVTDDLLRLLGFAYSHNYVLDVLVQLGLVGGCVYLWLIRPKPLGRLTVATPALVTILVHSMVEPNISTAPGATLFAGLVVCHAVAAMDTTPGAPPNSLTQLPRQAKSHRQTTAQSRAASADPRASRYEGETDPVQSRFMATRSR